MLKGAVRLKYKASLIKGLLSPRTTIPVLLKTLNICDIKPWWLLCLLYMYGVITDNWFSVPSTACWLTSCTIKFESLHYWLPFFFQLNYFSLLVLSEVSYQWLVLLNWTSLHFIFMAPLVIIKKDVNRTATLRGDKSTKKCWPASVVEINTCKGQRCMAKWQLHKF